MLFDAIYSHNSSPISSRSLNIVQLSLHSPINSKPYTLHIIIHYTSGNPGEMGFFGVLYRSKTGNLSETEKSICPYKRAFTGSNVRTNGLSLHTGVYEAKCHYKSNVMTNGAAAGGFVMTNQLSLQTGGLCSQLLGHSNCPDIRCRRGVNC